MTALSLPQWAPTGTERSSDEGRLNGDPRQNIASTPPPPTAHQQTDWLDEHHHAVSAMLMQRGFVPLYPQLVKASGSIKAALMLGQAIGLSRTWLQRDRSRNGWFWMSAADWQSATGLTAREQESARGSLVEAGLWEERRTHNPSRLYFRVHLEAVARALGLRHKPPAIVDAGDQPDDWQWDNAASVTVLGEAQMFFKPLADLTGSVMAGLLLSQLLARQRTALRERRVDAQGQFQIQYDELADHLLIGQKAMRNARDQLRRAGFISEQIRGSGSNARVHAGVNLTAMMACLQVQPSTEMNKRVAAARLAKPRADRQRPIAAPTPKAPIADSRQSSAATAPGQLSLMDAGAEQNQGHGFDLQSQGEHGGAEHGALLSIAKKATTPPSVDNLGALLSVAEEPWCPFVGSDGALLSVAYTEIEYREPTTGHSNAFATAEHSDPGSRRFFENTTAKAVAETPFGAAELIVPDGVTRSHALAIVGDAPVALRQVLLDELAGNMRSKRKNIDSPIGYLHVLTQKAIAGKFLPVVADDVVKLRQARAEAARREAPSTCSAAMPEADPSQAATAPGLSEKAEMGLAKLRTLRSQTVRGGRHDE